MAQELGAGRHGIADSDAIVARLQERMEDAASLAAFPALQAGNQRAAAVDAALLQADTQLDGLDREVLRRVLTAGEIAELQKLSVDRADLERRFSQLPKSESQVQGRARERLEELREEEKAVFKLSLVVQSLRAQAIAVQRMAEETRSQRSRCRPTSSGSPARSPRSWPRPTPMTPRFRPWSGSCMTKKPSTPGRAARTIRRCAQATPRP